MALGGKLVIDDNALFRQPEFTALHDVKAEHESVLAREAGITFVRLNGTIGCICQRRGLGHGDDGFARPRRQPGFGFLDLGSNIQRDKLAAALR